MPTKTTSEGLRIFHSVLLGDLLLHTLQKAGCKDSLNAVAMSSSNVVMLGDKAALNADRSSSFGLGARLVPRPQTVHRVSAARVVWKSVVKEF
jgi:hypothetical protein